MILLLDTSTPTCYLTLVSDDGEEFSAEWLAERELAKNLHKFIYDQLQTQNINWNDITALGVFKGPGSYTGLRIGLTVMNTSASSLNLPIVGEIGENWKENAKLRLKSHENDQLVLPEYGGSANITTARK